MTRRVKRGSTASARLSEVIAGKLSYEVAPTSFEFKPLYEVVYANLNTRNATSGGDEMLRLRTFCSHAQHTHRESQTVRSMIPRGRTSSLILQHQPLGGKS